MMPETPCKPHNRQSGFSLIELVVVITILGLIAAGTAIYIVQTTQAYSDSARRDQITSLARTATERVVREVRNALPNSIRLTTTTTAGVTTACIEFFPVVRASAYTDLPLTAASTSFPAVPFAGPGGGTFHIVVYPYAPAPLYNTGSPGQVADFDPASNTAAGEVLLNPAHQFTFASSRQRFFLVADPVSFCIDDGNNQLNRYADYGIDASASAPPELTTGVPATPALLADDIYLQDNATAVTPFTYTPGSLSRAAVVKLDFRFMQDGEWVRLQQEVQLRNAP